MGCITHRSIGPTTTFGSNQQLSPNSTLVVVVVVDATSHLAADVVVRPTPIGLRPSQQRRDLSLAGYTNTRRLFRVTSHRRAVEDDTTRIGLGERCILLLCPAQHRQTRDPLQPVMGDESGRDGISSNNSRDADSVGISISYLC